jgi:hypothetical protein
MRRSFSGVLDIYRFVLTASRVSSEDREGVEIAEHVFLATNSAGVSDISGQFTQFKSFLAAIVPISQHKDATHILRFCRSMIVDKFRHAVDKDPSFPLFDFANSEIESRFRLSDIDPYLARSLIASAIDHSAEAVWQFALELSAGQFQQETIHMFLDCRNWDSFRAPFPLFEVGDLINISSEPANV